MAHIADVFGESGVAFVDMASNQLEFGKALKSNLDPIFADYGLALDSFAVQSISLPEEIEKMLDTKIGMNVIGDMGRFTQFQVANSIPLAAQNEGGVAGIGAGLGAGMTMGQVMAGAMAQSMAPLQQPAAAPGAAPAQAAAAPSMDEIIANIEKLHGLVEKGILSKEEFDAKKAELMKKIS